MRDVYAWIDPFQGVDEAYAEGRTHGQADVVEWLGDEEESAFRGAFRRLCYEMAEMMAFDVVKPHMAMHYNEYRELQARKRLVVDRFAAVAQPMVAYMTDGKLDARLFPAPDWSDARIEVRFHTKGPFQFSVGMCPPEIKP